MGRATGQYVVGTRHRLTLHLTSLLALAACTAAAPPAAPNPGFAQPQVVADFDAPWAMTFLPDARMLVTEKSGQLKLVSADGKSVADIAGVPAVKVAGQGGLGDVVLSPEFANDRMVYLSWVEAVPNATGGAAVGRGRLVEDAKGARLEGFQTLWRQEPKVTGDGHFGHRIAFGPDGMMYISSGDRQKFTPAQDLNQNLGKIIRLTPTGGIPSDNPFYDQGRIKAQVWSYGHRNPLGIAFDAQGNLWEQEMGPKGGDEVNLVLKGRNYGYPNVSTGDHYDGKPIPDHKPGDGYEAPKVSWNPVISPGGLMIYSGKLWPQWRGDAFIGGLSSQALIRVDVDGTNAKKGDQWPMGARIREVEEGPDGAIWVLEDGGRGSGGRLLKLTPAS
jgi:glucose/arabinose dehydrogenase